jgi:uncharacterized protein YbaR (Trm112 family)
MPVNPNLLKLLACPDCRGQIIHHPAKGKTQEHLLCQKCHRRFDIIDNIPSMLPKDQP